MTLEEKKDRMLELIQALTEPIDELNGLLEEVLQETKHLDDSAEDEPHTGYNSINTFYMNLPVWHTLNDIKRDIENLTEQATEKPRA